MKLKDPSDRIRLEPVAFRLTSSTYQKLKTLAHFYHRSMAAMISEMTEKSCITAIRNNPEAYESAKKAAEEEIHQTKGKRRSKRK